MYGPEDARLLNEVIGLKLQFRAIGGAEGWFKAILSGVFANWLVGMAAFFAVTGRSLIGKHIPVLLAVIAFDAAYFQHGHANMAFFGLINATGHGPGWGTALAWSIAPAPWATLLAASCCLSPILVRAATSRARRRRQGMLSGAPAARSGKLIRHWPEVTLEPAGLGVLMLATAGLGVLLRRRA